MTVDTTRRLRAAFAAAALVPIGLGCKFYNGPGNDWIANSLGGVLYVAFWCFVAASALPRARRLRVALCVLAVTCLLEVLQLWHPPLLQAIRSTFVGRTLIGSSFDWLDFPHYAIGAVLGWLALGTVQRVGVSEPARGLHTEQ